MQFSSVATQEQPFFAQKATDPAAATAKQGRAELTAGLLQRVATEVSIAAAAQQRRGARPQPAGPRIAPSRLHGDSRHIDEARLANGLTIAALLRAASQQQDIVGNAPAGRRRPLLNNKLQKLARTLSEDDLAVAVGQVKVLAKARRRAA